MTGYGVRVGVGTKFVYDGELVEVVESVATAAGNEVVLRDRRGRAFRMSLKELMFSGKARIVAPEPGPSADDPDGAFGVVLAQLTDAERGAVLERAAHVREVLTGYRSGSAELAGPGEPQASYDPALPLMKRYAAKAVELGRGVRTIKRWVHDFRRGGEAGLVDAAVTDRGPGPLGRADPRWVETALEIMAEHSREASPTQQIIIARTEARVLARYGAGEVRIPSSSGAYRLLAELDRRVPTFHGSTKVRRDVADRPTQAYGKLRPTRPGEYLLLDTTRSDVFALDPVTLKWVQCEITVSMDWYSRCITGLRVTGSTKSIDVSSTLFHTYRPRPAPQEWPEHAVWPEHGIPRGVLIDRGAMDGPVVAAAGPALVPETIVVDHGKVYVSEHITSVCRRLGMSIQPARLRTGRDKGPIERFFRTLRQGLLEALPGYKGPDVYSRGLDPEGEAFLFIDELDSIIREWIAVVYHHRPHSGLVDPRVPGLALSPAAMFDHGIARSGYIEVPRDPDLAYEFLEVRFLTVHHYGVDIDTRRYNGSVLNDYRNRASGYAGGRWPFHVNTDDITRIYFRDNERKWHTVFWEHAASLDMPLSEEAFDLSRRRAAAKYTYPSAKLAIADLLQRWNMGLGLDRAERRMALRLSREQAAIDLPETVVGDVVSDLPSVRKVLENIAATADGRSPEGGDDDDDRDLDPGPDEGSEAGTANFYATALEDI
jgi:transposase InsO family protein